ncbi:MAG TPA: DUF6489 family protein [Acetobacteraceae bacterium]|jgi:hypothetical protein|nr:DUF6489 family protein [Acetobacteraceae bacterium]
MKLNIEIDCTPEEARRFLGLPDVTPMQDAVMAQIQKQVQDGIAAASPEALMRAWFPLSPLTPEQVQRAMMDVMGAAFTGRRPDEAKR